MSNQESGVSVRVFVVLAALSVAAAAQAQRAQLPDAPQPVQAAFSSNVDSSEIDAAALPARTESFADALQAAQTAQQTKKRNQAEVPVDADGKPIPLERQQPKRILGFMPNFRSVSSGATPPKPTWKNNFFVATHQSLDYSTFIFLGLTSLTAEGMNMHPALGKGVSGFYAYTWRGFLDKTDNTYLSAWLLPSLLHEDTRYYALGNGRRIATRELYVISRQAVARTYGGRETPNFAGLGGKVLTQVVSRTYYPPSATSFTVLASKFGYSVMRDVIFSSIREFYPDIAAHAIKKHREKMARRAGLDAARP